MFITSDLVEAEGVVRRYFREINLGKLKQIVIEEFLDGEEVSYICMTDGYHCVFCFFTGSRQEMTAIQGQIQEGWGLLTCTTLNSDLEHRVLEEIVYPTYLA